MLFAATMLFLQRPAGELLPTYTRQEDLIYGRKYGMALTMDMFKPKAQTNGLAVVYVISGGWYSSHQRIDDQYSQFFAPFLKRGYTIFAVVHGSADKFTIPEIIADVDRAIRFIRFHAAEYGIDPAHIGITGASSGGHLALMLGTGDSDGDPAAKDPVDRMSSSVQAVACFYPPTDFFNWGQPGEIALGCGKLADLAALFEFRELNTNVAKFVTITNASRIRQIGIDISPIYHVSSNAAPTLIMHGDSDLRVPIRQAETMIEKLKKAGVDAKLVVKPGGDHGWPNEVKDWELLADWFDQHLK